MPFMQGKSKLTVRLENKELSAIKRAAKLQKRSVNQFIVLSSLDAAKTTVESERKPVANPEQREATA